MEYVHLSGEPRRISVCEQHEQSSLLHPDRVMDEHDLVYILRGSWEICQNGQTYQLEAGSSILLAAGAHHWGEKRSSADCETIYIHFSRAEGDALLTGDALPAPEAGALILPVCQHGGDKLHSLFRRVVESYWLTDAYAQLQADARLMLLLTSLARMASTPPATRLQLVSKLLRMLDTNDDRFYTTGELAESIGVSSRTMLKYFHEATGTSVRQYQLSAKLEKAEELLLRQPGMPLAEVAQRLGFCDEYHLSKQYKKKYGCSPKRKK